MQIPLCCLAADQQSHPAEHVISPSLIAADCLDLQSIPPENPLMPINKGKQVAKPVVDEEEEEEEDPDWPDDESEDEDYGSDLESNGSYVSSVWEPIPPDELHLLAADLRSKVEERVGASEKRCVCSLCSHECPSIDIATHSRHDIDLTDEQASMLRKHITEFRAADRRARSKIIQDSVDRIERHWQQDIDFDREVV